MFLDWIVFGGLVCAIAALLNNWRFRARPATISLAVALSIVTFIVAVVALSVAGVTYYDTVRGMWGVRLPRNPVAAVHVIVPAAFALLFYFLLRKGKYQNSRPGAANSRLTGGAVKPRTVARLVGGAIIVFNLWLIGQYRIEGVMVLLLTFGVAVAFEVLIVRSLRAGEAAGTVLTASPERFGQPASGPIESRQAPAQSSGLDAPKFEAPSHLHTAAPSETSWASAAAEFEGTERRQGLWARLFSEANGIESVAKASYLRLRAAEIEEAEQSRIAAIATATAEAEARRREAERIEAQRTYDAWAKGVCPNPKCRAIIPLNSQACPSCGAIFEEGATWKVLP